MNERDLGAWIAAELTRLDARHEPPWRDAAPGSENGSEEIGQ